MNATKDKRRMMCKKTPFLMVMLFVIALGLARFIPLEIQRALLAVSVTLKSIILFLLPILIFSLLFVTFQSLGNSASRLLLIGIFLLCCSNFLATYLSHHAGTLVHSMGMQILQSAPENELTPLFLFQIPRLIPNAVAMLGGILGGLISPRLAPSIAMPLAARLGVVSAWLLRHIVHIIPPFLLGFLIKMQHDGILLSMLRCYAPVVIVIAISISIYLVAFYAVACKFRLGKMGTCLHNMLPAAICAFSSMSSAATLPYTLAAVEKNTIHRSIIKSIISASTNVHLIGDCIAIPILIYAILGSYGMDMPSTSHYLLFVCQFVVAKFSVAAVPGGGIMVMLPIIERSFPFDGTMSSVIFSMYLLLDPLCTMANVLGNGAFAQLMDWCVPYFSKSIYPLTEMTRKPQGLLGKNPGKRPPQL
jgi:Na+/H+-dicarboxylate symporter